MKRAYIIYIIQIYIYFLKRKFRENVLQNTPSCTIDKKSGEYAPIHLNIVCAVIHYLLFLYKNEYFYIFFYKILAKYSPKRTKLHHFLKFSRGSIPPNPSVWRFVNTTLFQKYFEPPPLEIKSWIRH